MAKPGNLKENIQDIIALTPAQEGMLARFANNCGFSWQALSIGNALPQPGVM